MFEYQLSPDQITLIQSPLSSKTFLEGPAGTGKTTVGVGRVRHLLEQRIPGGSILVLVPQRTLSTPYLEALQGPDLSAGGVVTSLTVGGLARRMVELYWPLVAEEAGFAHPDQPPTFLTLETAQYFMAHLVKPLLDQGYFDSVTIDRNRLYSQILDNLSKAAAVDFPHTEIGARLKGAVSGEPGQTRIYDDAQACATLFREYCLANNLLDFSLQLEVFMKHLWPYPLVQEHLTGVYRHLIVDNLEENYPVAHDLLREWLPQCDSALVIYDQEAGYRRFLGADPESAIELRDLCPEQVEFNQSFVTPETLDSFGDHLGRVLNQEIPGEPSPLSFEEARSALVFEPHRYYPEMLDWVAETIAGLVESGVPPGEIVVLAPFLPDSLRFSLMDKLEGYQVPVRSHRPSRSLREEPVTECLLNLTMLVHPQWGFRPAKFDIAYALVQAIEEMDLVRAQLLSEVVYRVVDGTPTLSSFDDIKPAMQERITYALGKQYERLRLWLERYRDEPVAELDNFLSLLFGELLSQPGYGFHDNYAAGETTANLIESTRKFRQIAGKAVSDGEGPLGKEYIQMVQDGVIAAQYIRSWTLQEEDAVLLAPAYTFLMRNRPVDYQFWLDVGSQGWYQRIFQPLTHPHVLSRGWPQGQTWSDDDEVATGQKSLYRLARGLLRRCRKGMYLGLSELSEQGYEYRGDLLRALDQVLWSLPRTEGSGHD